MTGTFSPDDPVSRDPEGGREAVERLQQRGESPTARVFAAGSALRESPLSLEAALVAYARAANDLDVAVAPAVQEELQQLCTVASEQGYAVDLSRVLERVTPSTKAEALAAARQRVDAPPQQRARQLATFVQSARLAGIDVSIEDFAGTPGMDEARPERDDRSQHALVGTASQEYAEPPVAETATEPPTSPAEPNAGVYPTLKSSEDPSAVAVDGGEEASVGGESADRETITDSESTGQEAARDPVTDDPDRESHSPVSKVKLPGTVEYRPLSVGDDIGTETSAVGEDTDDESVGENDDADDESVGEVEGSGFVWPAADDDVDPAVCPTVKSGPEDTGEPSREGAAAHVTDGTGENRGHPPVDLLEEIDLSASGETPIVRIVERERTDDGPPDPRALTASLSATETTVSDALESVSECH